jgi:hypothetical protein
MPKLTFDGAWQERCTDRYRRSIWRSSVPTFSIFNAILFAIGIALIALPVATR